ncbi:uncharacterized protein LOC117643980 [Thrips palmi]|uniref:Uncharacterized protein LOC117643980 n=1 Tax=Thrips palmi TaxID=161013 RepID=A0A6P8YXU7_THRPL|nr:uncharacterized protein LOC117643980 [Thrips palmi]
MTDVRDAVNDDLRAGARDQRDAARECLPYSDELLVDMVRARSNLFDKGRVDYKDEQTKAQSWEAIATTFGMRVEECQTRWVRLRERFGRELRLHKRGAPPGKEWPLFPRMRWLERFIQPRNSRVCNYKSHAANASASDSSDGVGVGVDVGVEEVAGPSLWTPFKLWSDGDHHANHHPADDGDSRQDMAVDLATHGAHSAATTSPSGPEYPPMADASMYPDPSMDHASMSPPDADFQDAVRRSLSVVAGSLEGIVRHLSADARDAHDPDELFARSLAASLRRLPGTRRSQAKMKLIAAMAEFEDGQ